MDARNNPRALAELAEDVARRAGDLLSEGLHHSRIWVETKSTGTDMVSEMDHASEELITKALLAARPDDGIVAEEGSAITGTSGIRWVVDPLDGTTNYLYGHPGWAVSIAAESDGDVLAGVVFDPVHGELFTASRGDGARRNGSPIACSDQCDLARTLVATGFAYDATRRRAQAEVLVGLLPVVRDIRRMGSAAIDLCSVACGRVDAYFERGLAWWDLAAGSIIAAEAGAVLTSLTGGPPQPGSILAAAPGIAGPLGERLSALGAGEVP
jgi:myo-inositol-1(or 4)-monophosphatase